MIRDFTAHLMLDKSNVISVIWAIYQGCDAIWLIYRGITQQWADNYQKLVMAVAYADNISGNSGEGGMSSVLLRVAMA